MMRIYAYLTDVLQAFVSDQWRSFKSIHEHQEAVYNQLLVNPETGQTPLKDLSDKLQMSEKEFGETILAPLQRLSLPELQQVLLYLNPPIRLRYGQELRLQPLPEMNALHWTVINVHKLGLKGVTIFPKPAEYFETHYDDGSLDIISSLFLAEPYCLPCRQCLYCGRLDTDPRGKPFGKQGLGLCHQLSCQTHSANLPDHDEHCCYRQWNRQKDNLLQSLKTHYAKPDEVKRLFQEFCMHQFKRNLSQSHRPRPEKDIPRQWQLI